MGGGEQEKLKIHSQFKKVIVPAQNKKPNLNQTVAKINIHHCIDD